MRSREQIEAKLATLVQKVVKSGRKPKATPEATARNIQAAMVTVHRLQLEVMLDMRDLLREIREQGKK